MESFFFFGRLHPLVLHLPIGFLLLAFLMEWRDRKNEQKIFAPAVGFALLLGMLSAIAAAISGFILSREGAYEESLLSKHQWLGIAVALVSVGVYVLHQRQSQSVKMKRLYHLSLGATVVLIMLAGHLGGSLTHGENYLAERAPGFLKPLLGGSGVAATAGVIIEDLDNALVYDDLIQPIFEAKCTKCHNASKTKGELLLTSQETIKKGGESGALFVKGDPEESLMMQRIHLPLAEKKHMPPRGKEQLSDEEVEILEWWIQSEAPFDKKIAELAPDQEIRTVLEAYTKPKEVSPLPKISSARESVVAKLRSANFPVLQVAEGSPYLEVRIPGRDSLTKNDLKQLNDIRKQLVALDLSRSNLTDDMLSIVKGFPHLQKLFLSQTNITDDGLKHLKDLEFLEYLNLYNTAVTDEGLEQLKDLKRLKNLYLWQTQASNEGAQSLMASLPELDINLGIADTIFGDSRLKAPLIRANRDIFNDTLSVALDMNLKDVQIRYTLDGSTPDSTSSLYDGNLLLKQSAKVQAIALKDGWESSEVAERQFVKARYQAKNIQLDKSPNDRYKANGPSSLVDFEKGTVRFTDGAWLGYEKSHFTATLDLGEQVDVSGVTVSALESAGSWIFFPKGMQVWTSANGQDFKQVHKQTYPVSEGPTEAKLANFTEQFTTTKARYVRVKVESNLVNPAWHPAPGEACWVFVDEILVE
jgi:predicted CXXCH cytochrome family protein